jgi:hypothetical protein
MLTRLNAPDTPQLVLTGILLLGVAVPTVAQGGTVTVSGGVLRGSGTVTATVVVADNGELAPGVAATDTGCPEISALELQPGAVVTVDVAGTTACDEFDQVRASSVSIDGAVLQITIGNGFTPALGEEIVFFSNSGGTITGTFDSLEQGATIDVSGVAMTVEYNAGDGNDAALRYLNIPSRPSITSIEGSGDEITAAFTVQTEGASPVSAYELTCTDPSGNASSVSGSASPLTLAGVEVAEIYACQVTAINGSGTSYAETNSVEVLDARTNIILLYSAFCEASPSECSG